MFNHGGGSFNFKYKTAVILDKLIKNRETHKSEYAAAMLAHTHQFLELLQKMVLKVSSGADFESKVSLRRPVSYEAKYDKAIMMLELCADEVIELDGETFAQYVMDEWSWSQDFASNTKTYLGNGNGE